MGPSSLRRMAATINAKVGMEFEMYVPDTNGGENADDEYEPDYDADESVSDFDDIISFFDNSDWVYNDPQSLRLFRETMEEKYFDWQSDEIDREWMKESKDAIRDYIVNNDLWDEDEAITLALEEMGLTDDEKNRAEKVGLQLNARKYNRVVGDTNYDSEDEKNWRAAQKIADEKLDEFAEEEWQNEGYIWDQAEQDYKDTERENGNYSENEFLRDSQIRTALDAFREFDTNDISWPMMVNIGGGHGSRDADEVASEFEKMIGRPVQTSDRYHGATRNGVSYIVEPDSSLDEPNSEEDAGLEFVSPPLPLQQMLDDLKKVKAWADKEGCYTNSSTGLHINVSIDGMSEENLDYVKLAILLGDKYVLEQFGRDANTYCKSGMEKVKQYASMKPEVVQPMMDKMRAGLNKLASRAIHTGSTDKYTSINNKGGYIEFRSPGDDWLGAYYDKIEPTLLRMVVALDAACDPQKARQEYLKKLYTLLNPTKALGPIDIFARYSAGEFTEMPKQVLDYLISQTRKAGPNDPTFPDRVHLVRQGKPNTATNPIGPMGRWTVTDKEFGYKKTVTANSAAGAITMAKELFGGDSENRPHSDFIAYPEQSATPPTPAPAEQGRWGRWVVRFSDGTQAAVSARNHSEAESAGYQLGRGRIDAIVMDTTTS